MEENFPIGEHILDRLTDGEQPGKADHQLDGWLSAKPENKEEFRKYKKIWDATTDVVTLQKFDSEKAWNSVDSHIVNRNIRLRRIKNLSYVLSGMAASLLIFFSLSYYTNLFSTPESTISMTTTLGSRSEVILPDGSIVKLNAGSSLEYHFDKKNKIRTVEFSGEAFFEVAKNNQPFIIHTPDGLKVKVLGTKFNLCSYPEDHLVQTSLVEGKVELFIEGSPELVLTPNQIGSFDKRSEKLGYFDGEVSHQLGWIQDKLYLDNMSLQEVCNRLEHWFDVQITIQDDQIGEKIHYTGVLKEQTVMDVLNALCRLSKIKYEINGKNIIISGR